MIRLLASWMIAAVALLGCNAPKPTPPAKAETGAHAANTEAAAAAETSTSTAATPAAAQHVDAKALAAFPTQRPADAVAFGGHWYKAFDNDICWHTAKAACERMGGHLACIETKAEQEFIAKLAAGRYFYLGAEDEAKEFEFRWVNGAKWEFTSWHNGQPNNYGGAERYLATYDGGDWVDVADEGSGFWMPKGFICEWPK